MISGHSYKNFIYEQLARIGKATGSPRRLEILDLLCQSPRTVEELSRLMGLGMANTSQHLQKLRAARLLETQKNGLHVTYRLASDEVCEFYQALRQLAETRLAEIEHVTRDFLEERDQLEPVDHTDLIERVRSGTVTIIDVRPAEEYAAGHISGAISAPLADLKEHRVDLPRDKKIVAYCRGPYCVLAIEAVELLRSRGFSVVRLEDGVPDWRMRGLPVAVEALKSVNWGFGEEDRVR